MNAIVKFNVEISGMAIRQDQYGRYCLNDLHKASGSDVKNKPSNFLQNDKTQELVAELIDAGNPSSVNTNTGIPVSPVESIRGGLDQGTYVVKQIVYAYAMWISAKFHLAVINTFDQVATGKIETQPKAKPIQLGSVTRQCAMMAKALGFKGNQHTLATDKAVKALTGQSPLELMGETHLIAENKQQVFTPTQLGEMVEPKISARKVNTVLEQLGYQEKANGVWIITPKGEKLCEMLDTGKKHGDGTPVKQVKWYQSVMDDIKRELKDICEGAKQ